MKKHSPAGADIEMLITLTDTLRLLPRALLLASVMVLPLMAMQGVRAGDQNIIEGAYKKSSGAGFVLMVSLRRAR